MPVGNRNILSDGGYCERCGNNSSRLYSADSDTEAPWYCAGCWEEYTERDLDETLAETNTWHPPGVEAPTNDSLSSEETYGLEGDYKALPDSPLVLPEMRDRLPRLLSFEQEVGSGGATIAERLHAGSYARHAFLNGYHSENPGGFCYVEEDSSVDAEVIYSRLALSKPPVAFRFQSALDVVRKVIAEGEARLTLRCGGHIHVDVGSAELLPEQRYGMHDVESLYHVWNHIEDTVHRLGSANWRSHRSIVGNDYAPDVRKGISGRGDLGRYFEDARGALNFSNYLQARGYCRCGAFTFEDWASCECDLPKATVEFRVFNTTANLRKIHAYTALSLALVEWAKRNTVKVDELPVHGWTRNEMPLYDNSLEALRFIFKELPLTYEEKKDLRYCADNSSLAEVAADLPTIRRNRRREAMGQPG